MTSECALVRRDLGAYVLGTIGPADRAAAGRHLAGCARCREELAGLAGLPALLLRLPVAEAALRGDGLPPEATGGAEGLTVLLGQAARVRRRRRLATAAGALAVLTATAWVAQAARPLAPRPRPAAPAWAVTASGVSRATGDRAVVRYRPRPWGTQLEVRVDGIPAGTTCQLWVTSRTGQRIPAGAWTVPAGRQHPWYPASAPLTPADLSKLEITGAGKILLTVQPSRRLGC